MYVHKTKIFSRVFPTYQFLEKVCYHDFVILRPAIEELSGFIY